MRFSGPGARTLVLLLVGGGFYGFFGPHRLMACDGFFSGDWLDRNIVCPAGSALIVMSGVTMWVVAGLWVIALAKSGLEVMKR